MPTAVAVQRISHVRMTSSFGKSDLIEAFERLDEELARRGVRAVTLKRATDMSGWA